MNSPEFHCRSCGSSRIHPVLNLGATPLANALLTAGDLEKPEAKFPLELVFCQDCSLLQITETVPPQQLFSHYLYFSSFSDTMLAHARTLVERLIPERRLNPNSLVVEVASNDGYLLQYYHQAGIPVLGIEPAQNIAQAAREKGINTLSEFFGRELAGKLRGEGKRADVIHAHNVLAHVADLNGFVSGIQALLKSDGVAIIEAPYVKDLIDHVEFDTIYHEHLCYFSLTALDALFTRHGLLIHHVERVPIHGGSLRIFAGGALSNRRDATVRDLLAEESAWGVNTTAFYDQFNQRVAALKTTLVDLLARLKSEGKTIAAYGASAKGSTLLNTFGIGRETLDFVADRSTIKQGHFTPGTHLPITSPDKLLADQPDYVLLLTWNFVDEILEQQAAYRERGGQFIVPIPEVRIV